MIDIRDVHEEETVQDDTTEIHDDVDLVDEEETLKDKLLTIKHRLKTCEDERQKHLDDLQRARADFLNSKRRLEEQLARDKERAVDKLLIELLTLADSFTMAMGDKDWSTLDEKWRLGILAIESKLSSILTSNNIIPIDPINEAFNPNEHEAVSNTTVTDDAHIDKVITVLQKGYKRGEDILRPARVIVGTK